MFEPAAEVERLWYIAKYILTDKSKGMINTAMFESLLYLKINRYHWTMRDVVEA